MIRIDTDIIRNSIDEYYNVFSKKDAFKKAGDFIGVSAVLVKKWYYGQELPPRWHHRQIEKLIKRANIRKEARV